MRVKGKWQNLEGLLLIGGFRIFGVFKRKRLVFESEKFPEPTLPGWCRPYLTGAGLVEQGTVAGRRQYTTGIHSASGGLYSPQNFPGAIRIKGFLK